MGWYTGNGCLGAMFPGFIEFDAMDVLEYIDPGWWLAYLEDGMRVVAEVGRS